MENNNEFFGVDKKYIPKSENNDKEYIKNDEKNIYEPENVNVEYTKNDKKKFNVFLIILLISLPFVIFITLAIIMSIMGFSIMGKIMGTGSDAIKETIKATSDIYESSSDEVEDATEEMSVQLKELFNSKFTAYEGEQRGAAVKSLITAVMSNNSVEAKQVLLKGVTTLTNVNSQKKYNIKMNYDSEGYINEIVITEAE